MAQESPAAVTSDFSGSMMRLLRGCVMLAHGVHEGDFFEVAQSVDSLNTSYKVPPQPVVTGDIRVLKADTTGVLPIAEAFDFSDKYGRKWIAENGGAPYRELPSLMRGKPEVKTLRLRLDAHAEATYTVRMSGLCHVFAAYEPATDIDFQILSDNVDIRPVKFAEHCLIVAAWQSPRPERLKLRLLNKSDSPASILLVSN